MVKVKVILANTWHRVRREVSEADAIREVEDWVMMGHRVKEDTGERENEKVCEAILSPEMD